MTALYELVEGEPNTVVVCGVDNCAEPLRRAGDDLACFMVEHTESRLVGVCRPPAPPQSLAELGVLCAWDGKRNLAAPARGPEPIIVSEPKGLASAHALGMEQHPHARTYRFRCSCGVAGNYRGTRDRAVEDHDQHCEDHA